MISDVSWKDSHHIFRRIKEQHLKTLIELWPSLAAVECSKSKWGDELEYLIVRFDHEAQDVQLSPRSKEILAGVKESHHDECFDGEAFKYMLESQPQHPYGDTLRDLLLVEPSMRARRQEIIDVLHCDERVLTLTNFGRSGSSQLELDPESLITDKKRYQELMRNIPLRAMEAADCNDIYADCDSSRTGLEKTTNRIDHPIFGLGGCGLQFTFSAKDFEQACQVHDQFIPLGPLVLALSAATPVCKGKLVETDTRWASMCIAADDRKADEKSNLVPRLGVTPMYLEDCPAVQMLNDRQLGSTDELQPILLEHGVPPAAAKYLTHIICRDPLMETSHAADPAKFLNDSLEARERLLQLHVSTWWPHVRLKLPVVAAGNIEVPWRIEFRPIEAQPHDHENAAFGICLRILQRAILYYGLDLRIPISAVENNMQRANMRSAVIEQQFWFSAKKQRHCEAGHWSFEGWANLADIFNGFSECGKQRWPGLLHIAERYLEACSIGDLSDSNQAEISGALAFMAARASGKLETPARWMRAFLENHFPQKTASDEEIPSKSYYALLSELS